MKNKIYRRKNINKTKTNHKTKSILILFITISFIAIFGTAGFFLAKKSDTKNTFVLEQDRVYMLSKNDYSMFHLIFSLNSQDTLNDLILYDKDSEKYLVTDINTYVLYDNKYYLLKDIINIIKQNRSENANINFIHFLENLYGIKFADYLYSYSDKDPNNYYTNNVNNIWKSIYKVDSSNKILLDKTYLQNYNSENLKVLDIDKIDSTLRGLNFKNKNVRIEIYNSTSLQGYGNEVSRLYKNMGFTVVRVVNYPASYANTTLFVNSDYKKESEIIKNIIKIQSIGQALPNDINSVADFILILGGDTVVLF